MEDIFRRQILDKVYLHSKDFQQTTNSKMKDSYKDFTQNMALLRA